MPLWDVNNPPWPYENFHVMRHVETLLSHDGPITFTFRDASGSLMLAHLCDEDGDNARYLVAPTSARIVTELKAGARSIYGAIDQPMTWLVDLHNGEFSRAWAIPLAEVPSDAIPTPEVMLRPALEPLLRTRAVGAMIRLASIPADAISTLVSGVEAAVEAMIDFVAGHIPEAAQEGAAYRFELDATRLAFSSIDIAFEVRQAGGGTAPPETHARLLREVERLFALGLEWSQNPNADLHAESAEEEIAILRALRALSPKRGGDAERVEISGRVLGEGRTQKILTNAVRQRASRRLRELQRDEPEPLTVVLIGRVGEVDRDRHTATFRNFRIVEPQGDPPQLLRGLDVRLRFRPEMLEEFLDALDEQYRIRVQGEMDVNSDGVRVVLLRPVPPSEPGSH